MTDTNITLPVREGWFLYALHHQHVRRHYQNNWRLASPSEDGIEAWKAVLCRLEDGLKIEESAESISAALHVANAMAEVEDRELAQRKAPKDVNLVDLLSRTAEALAAQIGDRKNPRWAVVREARNAVAGALDSQTGDADFSDPLDAVPSFAHRAGQKPKPFPLRLSDLDDAEEEERRHGR